jgi:hypothetical protein
VAGQSAAVRRGMGRRGCLHEALGGPATLDREAGRAHRSRSGHFRPVHRRARRALSLRGELPVSRRSAPRRRWRKRDVQVVPRQRERRNAMAGKQGRRAPRAQRPRFRRRRLDRALARPTGSRRPAGPVAAARGGRRRPPNA